MSMITNQNLHGAGFSSLADALHTALSVLKPKAQATAPDDQKAVATLIARLALLGHEVHPLAGGGYIVAPWYATRHCNDAEALALLLEKLGSVEMEGVQ